MKKNLITIIVCFAMLAVCISIIIGVFGNSLEKENGKLNIVVTIFPEYDFVKKICKDNANVKLLLNSGVDSHTYEPSVKDMKNINDSDIFIYTCDSQEPWAKTIIDSMDSKCMIINCSQNIELIDLDEFEEEYSILKSKENSHNHDKIEEYDYDGHIWLNPQNAVIMIDNICDGICKLDSANKDFYMKNAEEYKNEIINLDKQIEEKLDNEVLVFGGEFAYAYFIKRYDLRYISVYSSCGEGAEPSVYDVREVIDYINNNKVNKVFYEELTEGTVAKMISEETKAKPVIFYSIHNVSLKQFEAGEDYINIMKKNIKNITGKDF